jgi:hypothetical protein
LEADGYVLEECAGESLPFSPTRIFRAKGIMRILPGEL